MRNKLTWPIGSKSQQGGLGETYTQRLQCMHLSQTPGHSKERKGRKRNTPRRPPKPTLSRPPPQRSAENRPMTQTAKTPTQEHTTPGAEHTQHQTQKKPTRQTTGRERRGVSKGQLTRLLLTQPHASLVQNLAYQTRFRTRNKLKSKIRLRS